MVKDKEAMPPPPPPPPAPPQEQRQDEEDDEDDEWIGPMPSEAVTAKKKKTLPFEKVFLNNLPSAQVYGSFPL